MENEIATKNNTNVISGVKTEVNPFIQESSKKIFEVMGELNKLSLVTPHEVSVIEKAQTFLLSTYTDVPAHRTFLTKSVGVLSDARFPTPDSKYWQCKKEAEVQFYELMRELLNHQRTNINIKEVLYKKQKAKDLINNNDKNVDPFIVECDIERMNVTLAELNISLKKIEKEIKFRIAEIGDWLTISSEWEPKLQFNKDSYSSHETESMYRWLESQIREAKNSGDTKAVENFTDQQNTLRSLLNRKIKEAVTRNKG